MGMGWRVRWADVGFAVCQDMFSNMSRHSVLTLVACGRLLAQLSMTPCLTRVCLRRCEAVA